MSDLYLYIMKEDPSMNHSEFETEKMHCLELLRLLDACNPHLIALGYPPFDSSYEESEKINQVIQSARESMNHWDNMELTPISQI